MDVYAELMDIRTYSHRELIKALGGTTKAARTLNENLGEEVYSRQTVNYWKSANKIPDRVFFECPEVWLELAEKMT